MKRGWLALIGLVLFSSAVPLTQVMLDHSAPPRQTLLLTQRELMEGYTEDENSGVTLTWSWGKTPEMDSVSIELVAAMGMRCSRSDYACGGYAHGRQGWIVIGIDEHMWDGAADTLRRQADSARRSGAPDSLVQRKLREIGGNLDQLLNERSRLKMVAAGSDPDSLAAEWNDGQHLVLAARLHAYRQSWPRDTLPGEHQLFRVDAEPFPTSLYVPAQWAEAMHDSTGNREAIYDVVIGIGGRWLPRILEITRRPTPPKAAP